MPNRFTQIQNTPYVPQYSPPNVGLIQQAGQNLWKRQEQGAAAYDQIQETIGALDVLEQDKQLLQEKTAQINDQLSQFTDSNDFIDAMPALRKQARNLQAEITSGDIGTAIANRANALKTFENIESSDWSPQEKEAMKNMYLKDYRGAKESGRLDVFQPPEYVDIEAEVTDRVKELEKTERETIGLIEGQDGRFYKGKIRKKSRDPEDIQSTVSSMLEDNPNMLAVLRQQGKLRGEDPNEYALNRMKTLAVEMHERWGDEDLGISNIQWDSAAANPQSITAFNKVDVQSGSLSTKNIVPDFDDYMKSAFNKKILGKEEEFQTMKAGMGSVLSSMVKSGDLEPKDYDYFMDNFGEKKGVRDAYAEYHGVGWFGMGDLDKAEGIDPDPRMETIGNKIRKYVDKNEGVVSTSFPIRDGNQQDRADDVIKPISSTSMNLVSHLTEDMDEKQKQQFIENTLENGTFQGIDVFEDSQKPAWRFRVPMENEDGERVYETVLLEENIQPNIQGEQYVTNLDALVRDAYNGNPIAQRFSDLQKLHAAPITGEDVSKYLPAEYRTYGHIGLHQLEDGVTLDTGTKDNYEAASEYDVFSASILKLLGQKQEGSQRMSKEQIESEIKQIAQMVQNLGSLTETEKNLIMQNIGDYENALSSDLRVKLKEEMDNRPFRFSDKIEALNFAKRQAQR